jgi:hypothetical protein
MWPQTTAAMQVSPCVEQLIVGGSSSDMVVRSNSNSIPQWDIFHETITKNCANSQRISPCKSATFADRAVYSISLFLGGSSSGELARRMMHYAQFPIPGPDDYPMRQIQKGRLYSGRTAWSRPNRRLRESRCFGRRRTREPKGTRIDVILFGTLSVSLHAQYRPPSP